MSKYTTTHSPKPSPAERATAPKRAARTNTHTRANATAQMETDYRLTSQEELVSKKAPPPVQIRMKRFLSGRTLKDWRKAHTLSAHALALELGVSRSYIKSIEGGSLAASQKIIVRFNELRARLGERSATPNEDAAQPHQVISKFKLPASFEILARPVKCKTCKHHFIPRTPAQKFCGEKCARVGRAARAKTKRRASA